MPVSEAPYKRTYKHKTARGREYTIPCAFCGRLIPRYKTFVITKSLAGIINDPVIRQQLDRRLTSLMKRKLRICPACARFRGIAQPGKSVRKKHRK